MKTSESIAKIAPALVAAQREIGNALKNAKNPHFKNNYADLGAIIESVKEPLNSQGIAYSQALGELVMVGDTLTFSVTTRLTHESGEWIEGTAWSPLGKADPQGVGSATTYLRRYSLAAICGITQADDDGQAARPDPISAEQKARLADLSSANPDRMGKALAHFGVKSFDALNHDQAQKIINKLTSC